MNETLEKGPNMVELLPSVLLRFRENRISVIAYIRKAFQMIEVNEADRDFLQFLWWEDPETRKVKVFRHRRVVFGVNCSPFLLAAVLELHLKSAGDEKVAIAEKLLKSLYVDNCASSVATYDEFEEFREQATQIMADAKFELRGWECTLHSDGTVEQADAVQYDPPGSVPFNVNKDECTSKVLGFVWNKVEDTLLCEIPVLEMKEDKVTKRGILS